MLSLKQTTNFFRTNLSWKLFLSCVFCLSLLFVSTYEISASECIFINEIHYDNFGGDLDEGFEIAGPANVDLGVYEVWLYNGNGGTSYATISLSGVIDDEGNGYGAVWFPIPANGLQNGSPDGIALYDTVLAQVTEFLSYEGSFTASGGPADSMTSTDIVVFEPGAIGESLQLTGANGFCAHDFVWAGPVAHSRGAINSGQGLGGSLPDPTVGFSVPWSETLEGDTGAMGFPITVSISYNPTSTTTVEISDAGTGDASPNDYSFTTTSVSFLDTGATTMEVWVSIRWGCAPA